MSERIFQRDDVMEKGGVRDWEEAGGLVGMGMVEKRGRR